MAEKKPSKYSDHGAIGSAEELDAYGVWVKSEPQDLTAGMTESVNFDAEAVPYADFDMEFDNSEGSSEESNFDFPDLDAEIPEVSIENDEFASSAIDDNDNFDDGIKASYSGASLGRGGEEASTQLLMKIADELSAIRSELSTLKKEFAGVRIEGVSGVKTETRHGGFFDGEEGDDEKITLTGDEMENILTSANFAAPEEDAGFDPQREADEAALKEISRQNESAAEPEEEEEIKIDFDNLGISLDDDTGAGAEINDEFPPLEAGADLDEIPPLEELPSEELQEEVMPLEAVAEEDDEELQNLRREGASPLTPAPDNSVYLETDPFALDDASLEEVSIEDTPEDTSLKETTLEETTLEETTFEETPLEETSFAESGLTETTTLEEEAPAETISQDTASEITDEFSLDDGGLDLDTDMFSIDDESLPAFEEIGEEETDAGAMDISAGEKKSGKINEEETNEEISLDSSISLEKETSDEISFDNSISLEDETSEEISLDSPISLEEETSEEISLDSPAPVEEETSDEISFDSPISLEEETSEEISLDSPAPVEEEASEEISLESPAPAEEEIGGEPAFGTGDLDLSEAVIDEPDLSSGIVEAPLEEPVLGDISFGDDISLDIDDFGSGIDIDIADSGSADEPSDSPVESPAAENLTIDDIDTNIDLNAEEDIRFADGLTGDLALDDAETSVDLDTGDSGAATGLALDDTETSVELDMGDSGTADDLTLDDAETSVELDTGDSGAATGLTLDDTETSFELDTTDSGAAAELTLDDAEPSVELDTTDSGAAGGLTDDLASDLALDDFDAGIALDVKDDNASTDSVDDDFTGVIPEGLEINAKDAPISMDDDLEAFDEGEISLPETSAAKTAEVDADDIDIPANFKSELKSVLSYMDRLLESLPEDKIEEFAKSEYFDSYKKIFKELGLV